MKRFAIVPILAFAFVACDDASHLMSPLDVPAPAFANAQFTTNGNKKPTVTIDQATGALTVSFKITGLGSNVSVEVSVHGEATVQESCVNNGQNIPAAPNKTATTVEVDHTETFTSGRNGSVEGSITIPVPAGSLSCPGGQTRTLIEVSWENLSISFEPEFGQLVEFSFGGQSFSLVLWP